MSVGGDIINSIRDGYVDNAMMNTYVMKFADFTLTAAQMDTLNATPVSVLAAPGSGFSTLVTGIYLWVDAGATPFELGSGVLEFRYTDASGAKVITDITNAVVESAADTYQWAPAILAVPVTNAAIVAHTSTDVTAGDGQIKGRIYYRTISTNFTV